MRWTQDENQNPEPSSAHAASHKRRCVSQPRQRYTRGTSRVDIGSTMARRTATGRGRQRGGTGGRAVPGRRASITLRDRNMPRDRQRVLVDEQTTPRAGASGAKRLASGLGENLSQGSNSPSKRSRSTTSECSRASSPRKPNILRSLQQPIRNKSLDNTDLPDDARRLVRHVRRFAAGFETIPEELRASLEENYPDDLDLSQNVIY